MRLKAATIITLLIFAPACFYIAGDGKNARVSLLLSGGMPADVARIHVAVCQGTVSEENVLSVQTFAPTATIVVQASPGPDRIVHVIAVNHQGYAVYSGTSLPMTFQEGSEEVQVAVSGVDLTNITVTNPDGKSLIISWQANWSEQYEIQRNIGASSQPADSQYSLIARTYGKSYTDYLGSVAFVNYWYRVRGYSPIFDVYTVWLIPGSPYYWV
ncbi:MAG: hypothetical protein JXA20_03615 [Spirochaetes bacterium]|nr:hypothetical protein [Spirochaetota bacterium]